MKENRMGQQLARRLREAGALVLPLVAGVHHAPGWPDKYVASRAWTGWLELKSGDREATPAQRDCMAALLERGVPCAVLRLEGDRWRLERPTGEVLWEGGAWSRVSGRGLLQVLEAVARADA